MSGALSQAPTKSYGTAQTVSPPSARCPATSMPSVVSIPLSRITSYNVCYTKLLRCKAAVAHAESLLKLAKWTEDEQVAEEQDKKSNELIALLAEAREGLEED